MPHMANLSWIILFMLFNIMTMLLYFQMSLSSMMTALKNTNTSNKNKKWLW